MATNRAMKWDAVVSKLSKVLNINTVNAEYVLGRHMGKPADENEDVLDLDSDYDCDRFARAMRHAQREPENKVSINDLTQALLCFHLECDGVDISVFPSSATGATTAHDYLDALIKARVITVTKSLYAKFYFITEKCIIAVRDLLPTHDYNLFKAVHGGLASGLFDRQRANVAMFCLLTDLSPTEARNAGLAPHIDLDRIDAERKSFAAAELSDAVNASLANREDLILMERALRCVQAEMFPFESSRDEITRSFLAHARDDNEDEFSEARAQYRHAFFIKQTRCADSQEVTSLLAQHDSMEKAVRAHRNKVLAPPALPHVRTFDTPGFPYADPNTIIIGLVGTVDDDGPWFTASPATDGWFISDALFHKHCLEGMGSEQTWLFCVDFDSLLKKYGSGDKWAGAVGSDQISWSTGYLHGQATDERRVVLDHDTLEAANRNVQRYAEGDLLKAYLALLDTKFAQAQKTGCPVLLLMFAHGDIDSPGSLGGLVIGFRDPSTATKDQFLTAANIETVHRKYPKVQLSLFMTSCFSGHWVTTPYFNAQNITVMAGTRPDEESHAWRESESYRHGGGLYSSAFIEELKKEPGSPAQASEAREYQDLMEDLAARCEGLCSPTDVDKALGSLPMFTPDATHEKFYQRTGYALHDYKANYDKLKKVPVSREGRTEDDTEGAESTGRIRTGRIVPLSSRMSSYGQTTAKIQRNVSYSIFEYKKSNPNKGTWDHEIEHLITQFKKGILSEEGLSVLQAQLTFRMAMLRLAEKLVKQLELYLGAVIDVHTWDDQASGFSQSDKDRVNAIVTHLRQNTNWFKSKKEHDGQPYAKPYRYVAYAMYLHGIEGDRITTLINKADEILHNEVKVGSKRVRGGLSWKETMDKHRKRGKLTDFVHMAEGQENPGFQGLGTMQEETPEPLVVKFGATNKPFGSAD